MQKILLICLVSLFGIFQYQFTFGSGGELDNKHLHTQIIAQQKINSELESRNNRINIKIVGLKGSSDFLEARARQEFNWVKSGETLILLPSNSIAHK